MAIDYKNFTGWLANAPTEEIEKEWKELRAFIDDGGSIGRRDNIMEAAMATELDRREVSDRTRSDTCPICIGKLENNYCVKCRWATK